MRVVFMGTPEYATKILGSLLKDFDVVALFTQPDKPVGRKKVLTPPHIKSFVLENDLKIPIYQPNSLKEREVVDVIKSFSPDFIVVAAYGKILPKEILNIAPCINLHASLLPKYRGASPIQHSLLNGDEITGVTAMLMNEGLDSGDILAYSVIDIKKEDNAKTLFNKLALKAQELTPLTLKRFNNIKPIKQFDVDATYCKKILKSDGEVEFDDALRVFNKYRAFIVWPGIFLKSGLKLKEIDLESIDGQNEKGIILSIEKDYITVGCAKGALRIFKVQPPSKKEMDILSYIRGKRLKVGDYLL